MIVPLCGQMCPLTRQVGLFTQRVEIGNSVPTDRWFVTNGVVAVGPVTFDLVLRGVAYGRISTRVIRKT